MFRLAVKSVRQKPGRLVLTAIAVALGVSLAAATFTITNSLSSGFHSLFGEIYSGTDVIVEADPNAKQQSDDQFAASDAILSPADVAAVSAVDGVAVAGGSLQVNGTVLPKDPSKTSGPGGAGAPSQIYNWSDDERLQKSTVVDGHGISGDDQVLLDIDSVVKLGYALGDTVSIATDTGVAKFTLVGTVKFGKSNSLQGATLALVSDAAAHTMANTTGYQAINVIADDGVNPDDLIAPIAKVIPDGTRAITGEQKAKEQNDSLGAILNYINIFAIAFALISLFVGAYIIVNTFRIIVTQRTREFGLLRAIGATGKQIRRMILLEALVVGAVASTFGILLGYLFALGATSLLALFIGHVFGTLTLPLTAIGWSYALGVLVTLGAALTPAIHASTISPMAALREAATESKKPLGRRNIVGGALFALGLVAVFVGLYASLEKPFIYVGAGALLLILGATLLAAQVLVPLAYALRGALTSIFRIDGKLAANNIRREPRRSANTAAALMIGVMLLALTATFTESTKTVITGQFQQIKAQLIVLAGSPTGVPQEAMDIVAGVEGVKSVTRLASGSVHLEGSTGTINDKTTTEFEGNATDAATVAEVFNFHSDPPFSEINGGVFIGSDLQALGIKVGDTVTLKGDSGTENLKVTGLFNDEDSSGFFMDWDTATELFSDVPIQQGLVVLDNGADVDKTQTAIESALHDDYPLVSLQQPGQLVQILNTAINIFLGFISALLLTALLIALLGVANTLLLSVTERTREIGLLRAVGLKRSSIWRMITIESMVMALFGTVLGMILGVGLGSALVLSLKDQGFDGVAIPWVLLAVYTVLAAIAGVLAAIWPAWRASRLDILQAIAADG